MYCIASDTLMEEKLLKDELDSLVSQGSRIIVYDSNIKKLHQLYDKYRSLQEDWGIKVSFMCSKQNKQYAAFIDKQEYSALMETSHISSDVLFVTSALNTGISIDEDIEYLFIFGNPSKTDIYQLLARVRRGKSNRQLKTVYCSVPKYNSVKCRIEGLELDLSYLLNPVEWQRIIGVKSAPSYVQIIHEDINSKATTSINQMRLGKLKQDIKELRELFRYSDMKMAYTALFNERYSGITVTYLAGDSEKRAAEELKSLIEQTSVLPFLGKTEQQTIKSICTRFGLQTTIGKINALLSRYDCGIQLQSKAIKDKGKTIQAWFILATI